MDGEHLVYFFYEIISLIMFFSGKKLFREPPHFTMDNHFSGDAVIAMLGERGFKGTCTTRRDRLVKGVPNKYFHHTKETVNDRSKAARFHNPIVAVKTVTQPRRSDKKNYRMVVVSFQSTGSTNITTVNALDRVGLYVAERQRGRNESKRKWGIEMNEARALYLSTYSAVDKIDQLLKEWRFKVRSWKWWHAPAFHGIAIAMNMAYELYKECASGNMDPSWKLDKVLDGPDFRHRLSEQMCTYDPRLLHYHGDSNLRITSKINKARRGAGVGNNVVCDDGQQRVGFDDYLNEKKPRQRGAVSRFALESSEVLKKHLESMTKVGPARCKVCMSKTFWRCSLCDARVCLKSGSGLNSLSCVLDYHSEDHYGLCKVDRQRFFGEKPSTFHGVSRTI